MLKIPSFTLYMRKPESTFFKKYFSTVLIWVYLWSLGIAVPLSASNLTSSQLLSRLAYAYRAHQPYNDRAAAKNESHPLPFRGLQEWK